MKLQECSMLVIQIRVFSLVSVIDAVMFEQKGLLEVEQVWGKQNGKH